ncbi:MAG: hypothetical protein FJ138_04660 [Deltaproteobacteria bacterium]|nr:hypothetical protein [Deltaproteobacteria bacterium]
MSPLPPLPELLAAAAIAAGAGAVQGVTGFGSGLIAAAALSQLWAVPYVTVVLSPPSALLTLALLASLRADAQPRALRPLLLTLPLGVALGLLTLGLLPAAALKGLLAVALLGAVAGDLLGLRPRGALPAAAGGVAGLLAGAMGAAFNTSGPPILIYASLAGWAPRQFRANLSLLFCVTAALSLAGHAARGALSADTLLVSLCLTPGLVLGALLGGRVADRLPRAAFLGVVRGLLVVIAGRLCWELFGDFR